MEKQTYLNTAAVNQALEVKGVKIKKAIEVAGLKSSMGYTMIRDGLLPKDEKIRSNALKKLAEFLNLKVGELVIELDSAA